ncbi:MAG: NlpC/P60 family protein [Desulfobacterales bacterium]
MPAIAFTIQVGAFSTVERAANYADRLAAYGLDTYYFIDIDGLCKVRFERFESKAAAQQRAFDLQGRGIIDAYYIVRPGAFGRRYAARESLQENLVRTAQRFIGTPYRWGGTSARSGFDCSGLTMTVYRLNGLELPRHSRSQFQTGRPVARDALERGDLVFFATRRPGRVSHVGLYRGQGQFIHAPGRGKTIRTASLSDRYYKARYAGARRYF